MFLLTRQRFFLLLAFRTLKRVSPLLVKRRQRPEGWPWRSTKVGFNGKNFVKTKNLKKFG